MALASAPEVNMSRRFDACLRWRHGHRRFWAVGYKMIDSECRLRALAGNIAPSTADAECR